MKKTIVIGIGSILRRDDGIGPRIIKELEEENLPNRVKLLSADVSGLDLLKYFPGFGKVVVIDTADMGMVPGTVRIFDFKRIKKSNFKNKTSTHGIGLLETLTLAKNFRLKNKITIIGIQPYDISYNLDISKQLKRKIPLIIKKVKKVI